MQVCPRGMSPGLPHKIRVLLTTVSPPSKVVCKLQDSFKIKHRSSCDVDMDLFIKEQNTLLSDQREERDIVISHS